MCLLLLLLSLKSGWHKLDNTQALLFFTINIWLTLLFVAASAAGEQPVHREYRPGSNYFTKKRHHVTAGTKNALQLVRQTSFNYAMLVDCGSSGTQAFIYYWPSSVKDFDEITNQIRKLQDSTGKDVTFEKSPGLSSVREDPSTASEYTRPFMDFAREHIPREKRANAPVMFMATAGLRQLNDSLQHRIMSDIVTDLKRSYTDFRDIRARVISGFEEGSYMWLSANGVAGRLKDGGQLDRYGRQRHYSIVEMGGASVQVTFGLTPELDKRIQQRLARTASAEAQIMFQRSRRMVPTGTNQSSEVFSISLLGFGSNAARDLATDLLVRDFAASSRHLLDHADRSDLAESTFLIGDPCLPIGGTQVFRKSVGLLIKERDSPRPIGQSANDDEPMFNARFIGTRGNVGLCQQLLMRSIMVAKAERYECPHKADQLESCPVSLLAVDFVPFDQLHMIGLSEFFYISRAFYDTTGLYQAPVALSKIMRLCQVPYQTLLKQYPDEIPKHPKQILLGCFKANWIFVWLHFALRMPQNYLLSDLTLIQKLNNINVEWTRGALIAELSKAAGNN